MARKIVVIMMLFALCTACGEQRFVSLPTATPSPSPTPSPAVPPASQTALGTSTMSMSTSASHRAVMGVVSMGGAAISKSQNNTQITGTLQQGKDRMALP